MNLGKLLHRTLYLGITGLVIGFPLYIIPFETIQRSWRPEYPLLKPVPMSVGMRTGRIGETGTDMLFGQFSYFTYSFLANVGLAVVLIGTTLSVISLVGATIVETGVYLRLVGMVLSCCLLVGTLLVLILVSTLFRRLLLNVVLFCIYAGVTVALSTGLLLAVRRRVSGTIRLVVLSPLATGSTFLSLIFGSLAAPAPASFLVSFTRDIVRFLLLNVFSVGGFNVVLAKLFELDRTGIFLFWLGVNVLLGWTLGITFRMLDLDPARTCRRVKPQRL